jgi:hypothetical protein
MFPETKFLLDQSNVKYIKSFASSTASFQIGAEAAEGKLLATVADDGQFYTQGFDESIDLFYSISPNPKDGIILRYREGPWQGWYWANSKRKKKIFAKTKETLAMPEDYWAVLGQKKPGGWVVGLLGIHVEYKLGAHFMFFTDYFREVGGFDCQFEHLAFSTNDFMIRAQNNGSVVHLSPVEVENVDWRPSTEEHAPVQAAFDKNDFALMRSYYSTEEGCRRVKIDFDNWKNAPEVWPRRWPTGIPDKESLRHYFVHYQHKK